MKALLDTIRYWLYLLVDLLGEPELIDDCIA